MSIVEQTIVPFRGPETEAKPQFNAHSLDVLVGRMNAAPDILAKDWREIVYTEFSLSGEQARSLVEVAPERVSEIQFWLGHAAEYIRAGGALRGTILTLPEERRSAGIAHGILLEMVEASGAPRFAESFRAIPKMLRIAHCDANCRNWQWNSF
jgi:hypothetical protein